MVIRRLTDSLYLVNDPDWKNGANLAATLNASIYPGVEEVTASYDTLGIYGHPEAGWEEWIRQAAELPALLTRTKTHVIPVCYELGEDWEPVAQALGLSREEIINHHTSQEYTCFAVGFQPGFAYLGPLPTPLSGLARRSQPRPVVAAGSVGICQNQTAVYPIESPGGWHLIGRCPLILVDVGTDFFPISAGDHIRFRKIGREEYEELLWQPLT